MELSQAISRLFARREAVEAKIRAHTTISLGCENCPARRTFRATTLSEAGSVTLRLHTSAPVAAETELEVLDASNRKGARLRVGKLGKVAVNPRPCNAIDDGCPYREAIDRTAREIEGYIIEELVDEPTYFITATEYTTKPEE